MFRLLKYFRWWYWPFVVLVAGITYIQVTLDLELPEYMGKIIAHIILGARTGQSQTKEIVNIGLEMGLITLGSVACTLVNGLIAARIGAGFARRTREAIYDKVGDFSLEEMNQFSTASLITRTTNDVQQIQMIVIMVLRMAITAPLMAIKGVVKIWGINGEITLTVAIAVVLMTFFISLLFIFVMPKFKKMQTYIDDLNLVTRENLTGLRVVRANNAEKIQSEKFETVNDRLTRTNLYVHRTMGTMMPVLQLIMSGVNLAIVWVGSYLIGNNLLGETPADGVSLLPQFTTYAVQIVNSFLMVTMMLIWIPRSAVSVKRIVEVLKTKTKITNPSLPVIPDANIQGTVEFRNVSFKYPGAEGYVLENISFTCRQGETIAFIGATGSGKTTLINLIPRLFDVSEGEVLVDGVNVKQYSLETLYEKIGYVPQQALLFSGTVASNVRIGSENSSEEDIWEAIAIAQANEFVSKMEEGLEAPISQGGKNVSGGQKQRLSIARAIAKNPEIFIFDDSFSALDYHTDVLLRKALREKLRNATKLIVAQRIGTILDADKIVVLENGKIAGIGTHHELLKTSAVYQEIARSQLSMEELSYGN